MSDLGLSKESIKGLGPGAYLVNVLPSALLVAGIFAAMASRLYPWQRPRSGANAGLESLLGAIRGLGFAGGLLIIATILFTAIVLRPFQISAVQWLVSTNHPKPDTLTTLPGPCALPGAEIPAVHLPAPPIASTHSAI